MSPTQRWCFFKEGEKHASIYALFPFISSSAMLWFSYDEICICELSMKDHLVCAEGGEYEQGKIKRYNERERKFKIREQLREGQK